MRHLASAFLLLLSVAAMAEETTDCAKFEDRDERLACFDRLFPSPPPARPEEADATDAAEKQPVEAEPPAVAEPPRADAETHTAETVTPAVEAQIRTVEAVAPAAPAPDTGAAPPAPEETANRVGSIPVPEQPPVKAADSLSSPAEPEPLQKGGLFDNPEVDLTGKIVAVHQGEKQKMVFLLDNNQIWMQSSPRPLPFREGDTVSIRNATMGGYFMRSTKGTSTRVQRID